MSRWNTGAPFSGLLVATLVAVGCRESFTPERPGLGAPDFALGGEQLLTATFDAGADGFGYRDDAFRGTAAPAYASGAPSAFGGFSGGGLGVRLGGIDDTGKRVARYDKMHLFGLELGEHRFDESRTIEPGEAPVALDTPFGRLGLSVCYDVRFPELYRAAGPVDAWFVPSAFTAITGGAHWDTLLRSRAIENQCYVIAPAQGGLHANGRRTHGHTMIVDPWGEVLASRPEGEGVVAAELDTARIAEVRQSLPALAHRKMR